MWVKWRLNISYIKHSYEHVLVSHRLRVYQHGNNIKTWKVTCNNSIHNLAIHVISNKWRHMWGLRLLCIRSIGTTLTHINLCIHHSRMTLTWRNVLYQWWLPGEYLCHMSQGWTNMISGTQPIAPPFMQCTESSFNFTQSKCSSLHGKWNKLNNHKITPRKNLLFQFGKKRKRVLATPNSKYEGNWSSSLLLLIREVRCSNLDPKTGYSA